MMWKLGRETTAIWSVNQTRVFYTQREKKALICQKKKKNVPLQRITEKSPKNNHNKPHRKLWDKG